MSTPLQLSDVSRETHERLSKYVAMLEKWTAHINLVSRSTLPDIWTRHIEDSIQVFSAADGKGPAWLDLGSGGGLPGIVVAILAAEFQPSLRVTMVESDQRKATFLRSAIREVDVQANVFAVRIEDLEPQGADVISARALAELSTLLEYCERHLGDGGVGIFPKGQNWQKEVDNSSRSWRYTLETRTSETAPNAAILKVGEVHRV